MVPHEFELKGKLSVVTGIRSGWFLKIAGALAEAGSKVIILSDNSEEVRNALESFKASGKTVEVMKADITNTESVRKISLNIAAKSGPVDILVNAADLSFAKPLTQITDEEWSKVLTVNLTSAFICCRAFLSGMIERKKGKIINIASALATRGVTNFSVYSASKGGLVAFSRALAIEVGKNNVRVTAVAPGWYESPALSSIEEEEISKWIPLKRKTTGDDIGSLVAFLASDAADYVTGNIYYVDGGTQSHS